MKKMRVTADEREFIKELRDFRSLRAYSLREHARGTGFDGPIAIGFEHEDLQVNVIEGEMSGACIRWRQNVTAADGVQV